MKKIEFTDEECNVLHNIIEGKLKLINITELKKSRGIEDYKKRRNFVETLSSILEKLQC